MVALLGVCMSLLLVGVNGYYNDNRRHEVSGYATEDLASPSFSSANLTSILDTIKTRGFLRVGTTGDYKPLTYKVTNSSILANTTSVNTTYIGADMDMALSLSTALSLTSPPVFVPSVWANLTTDIKAGKFDIGMGGISITLARAQAAYFSSPIQRVGKIACIRCADAAKFTGLDTLDQAGVKIAVNPGGTNQAFDVANFQNAEIVLVADNNAVYQAVIDGTADSMVSDVIEVEFQVKLHEGVLCAAGDTQEPWTYEELGYLLPRGDQIWKEFVDTWVRIQLGGGAWNTTLTKWMDFGWPSV